MLGVIGPGFLNQVPTLFPIRPRGSESTEPNSAPHTVLDTKQKPQRAGFLSQTFPTFASIARRGASWDAANRSWPKKSYPKNIHYTG